MQSATLYLFPFKNESDFSNDFGFWNWVKNGTLFFKLESLPYLICFKCVNYNFFSAFFFSIFYFVMPYLDWGEKQYLSSYAEMGDWIGQATLKEGVKKVHAKSSGPLHQNTSILFTNPCQEGWPRWLWEVRATPSTNVPSEWILSSILQNNWTCW